MNKKAIITTRKDWSAQFFAQHGWDVFFYDEIPEQNFYYDIVYFRDPFNDERLANGSLEEIVNRAIGKFKWEKSIDGIDSFEKMKDFEDKYFQFEVYKEWMPETFLPSTGSFEKGKHLIKKRLSQRAKDIAFEVDGKLDDDWIIQELMEIREELRVYIVFGKVIRKATIKTSKKANSKVKVVGERELTDREMELCEAIAARRPGLDFSGIDLACLENGKHKLIEVNRSPQFKRFAEIYGESELAGILDL